jgi:ribosome-binding protein aMBF1 (putative translation factor)
MVTNTEDLLILNKVIDKYVPQDQKSLTPKEAFGDDWTDKAKKIGRIIQGLRFRDGMNQSELAKALRGVKQSNISAWENGKERIPEKRLKQLSDLFGTDLLKLTK